MYAIYLVDIMKSPQQALQELINAQNENPVFDQEFIVFRYKKVIENEIFEKNTTNNNMLKN